MTFFRVIRCGTKVFGILLHAGGWQRLPPQESSAKEEKFQKCSGLHGGDEDGGRRRVIGRKKQTTKPVIGRINLVIFCDWKNKPVVVPAFLSSFLTSFLASSLTYFLACLLLALSCLLSCLRHLLSD